MRTSFNEDKDVKIVLDSAEMVMSRAHLIQYLKKAERITNSNTKVLRKKMKGVCFSELNLRTDIPDDEITAIQKLMLAPIMAMAAQDGKIAIRKKGSKEAYMPAVQLSTQGNLLAVSTVQGNHIINFNQ
jgi:hypothetical protein